MSLKFSALQQRVLRHVSTLQQRTLHQLWTNQPPFVSSSTTDLDAWFKCFDGIFFGGMLQGRCAVSFNPDLDSIGLGETYTHHQPHLFPGFSHSSNKIPIVAIDILSENPNLVPLERRVTSVETLLHEMTHAFLDIYSCECEGIFPVCHPCREKFSADMGEAPHGFSWHSCFMVIQEACWKLRLIDGTSAVFTFDWETSFASEITQISKKISRTTEPFTGDEIRRWDVRLAKRFNISKAAMEALELDRENIALRFELASRDNSLLFLPNPRSRFSPAKKHFRIDPNSWEYEPHVVATSGKYLSGSEVDSVGNTLFWRIEEDLGSCDRDGFCVDQERSESCAWILAGKGFNQENSNTEP